MQETSLLELPELNLDYFFETVRLHGYNFPLDRVKYQLIAFLTAPSLRIKALKSFFGEYETLVFTHSNIELHKAIHTHKTKI